MTEKPGVNRSFNKRWILRTRWEDVGRWRTKKRKEKKEKNYGKKLRGKQGRNVAIEMLMLRRRRGGGKKNKSMKKDQRRRGRR